MVSGTLALLFWFLDASMHLYKRVCLSVRWSIHRSIRPLVDNPFLVVSHDSIRGCVRPSVHPSDKRFFGHPNVRK